MHIFSAKIKKNLSWIKWVIPAVCFGAVISVILVNYDKREIDIERESVMATFEDEMSDSASYYEERYRDYKRLVTFAAQYCEKATELKSQENFRLLDQLCDSYPFVAGYIIGENGGVDQKGRALSEEELADFEDISRIGAQMSDFKLLSDGQIGAFVSAPIRRNEEEGLLVLRYEPTELSSLASTPNYVSTNIYAIVASDGTVVERGGMDGNILNKGNNLYKELEKYTPLTGSTFNMKQDIENGEYGYMVVWLNTKTARYFMYKPIGNTGSYYLMSVNSGFVEHLVSNERETRRTLLITIFVVMAIFLLLICGIGIRNATKHAKDNKELKNLAETDLLTELYNKIATEEKIKDYLQNEGKGKSAMMFVLDIDNFKNINDTMGHAFGDEVVSTLGRQLKSQFRINDIVGRTGGDEFTVFIKDIKDDTMVHSEAERIVNFFKDFKVGEYTKYFATASIGAAVYPKDADSFETLYKAADQALYKAKNRGKNQLAFYHDDSQ